MYILVKRRSISLTYITQSRHIEKYITHTKRTSHSNADTQLYRKENREARGTEREIRYFQQRISMQGRRSRATLCMELSLPETTSGGQFCSAEAYCSKIKERILEKGSKTVGNYIIFLNWQERWHETK